MAEVETLTDEQIDELLTQAETRLRAKSQATNEDEILFETGNVAADSKKLCVYLRVFCVLFH
jgi:hypothetical protein